METTKKSKRHQIWEAGWHNAFLEKFTGEDVQSIIQVKEGASKAPDTSINISLLLPRSESKMLDEINLVSFPVALRSVRKLCCSKARNTAENMWKDAQPFLAEWLGAYIDRSLFAVLTGTLPKGAECPLAKPLVAPTENRLLVAGGGSSESDITAADTFNTSLISAAKRFALADEDMAVRSVTVNGKEIYVMVIDPWQARDLKNDPKWLEAQKHANICGEEPPIFSGALGIYDGVVIHESNRVPRTATGASNTKVGHALFLGAQAAVFVEGENPRWVEKKLDDSNKYGIYFECVIGVRKSQFKYDGRNNEDFGVINVLTSSVDD